MKTAIYSVLFGAYDKWIEPKYVQPDADYFIFTNQEVKSYVYTPCFDIAKGRDVLKARRYKIIRGYEILCKEGYDLIIYHDCNIVQTKNLDLLIKMQVNDLMILRHPLRDCIYNEFHACVDGNKDKVKKMYNQVQKYADDCYPEKNGLVASGVIFRRNNKKVLEFCKRWFTEIKKGSIRDQLSYNYIAWKMKYKFDYLDWNFLDDYFIYNNKHKN